MRFSDCYTTGGGLGAVFLPLSVSFLLSWVVSAVSDNISGFPPSFPAEWVSLCRAAALS